ncbi:MAG: hypothetical protein ACRCXX_07210 [Cetobacterium sp.]|uniref:hypothetical protein n=1 Tax=Cetobacterium sp. TaxID=2071632 RepID=UPI003F3AF4D9
MKKIRETLEILTITFLMLGGFFGSLFETNWLQTYCIVSAVMVLIYGAFVKKIF